MHSVWRTGFRNAWESERPVDLRDHRAFSEADVTDLYSNPLELPFTPDELRKLAVRGDREVGLSEPVAHRPHELFKRLGVTKLDELIARAQRGESVRSLAREVGVVNSALIRALRERGAAITKTVVDEALTKRLAAEYEAGATMRELEEKFKLSHGAVIRALHRSGVEMRAKAPRKLSK
jgi:transposase-like protein